MAPDVVSLPPQLRAEHGDGLDDAVMTLLLMVMMIH